MQQSHHTKLLYFDTQRKQMITKNMSIGKKFQTTFQDIIVSHKCGNGMQGFRARNAGLFQQPQTNLFKDKIYRFSERGYMIMSIDQWKICGKM